MKILTINAGSSSVRLEVFDIDVGDVGAPRSLGKATAMAGDPSILFATLAAQAGLGAEPPSAVAHRWVHGGPQVRTAALIDANVEAALVQAAPLAPLHAPASLAWLAHSRTIMGPDVRQIVVPDTAYFASLPDVATSYALPRALSARYHLHRYGFHGLAHQSMVAQWLAGRGADASAAKVISLQLGAGCSIAASQGGAPVDTSMGFTPLEGLVMATRAGDIDAGLLLYLQRETGMDAAQIEVLLNQNSGLLGLSGISGDMRMLLASDSPEALGAIALYCYRAKKYIGAYLAALGGADAVLFGGGVGENSPVIRAQIIAGMQWCGLKLDAAANQTPQMAGGRIGAADSLIEIAVIHVDEAHIMARAAADLLVCS
ncbi:MAG: acetate/propionate family kinase [Alphaproteobacteria bacterium]|nr:acetate/propionate family kinase [Alphaproteobacteria bacterium]